MFKQWMTTATALVLVTGTLANAVPSAKVVEEATRLAKESPALRELLGIKIEDVKGRGAVVAEKQISERVKVALEKLEKSDSAQFGRISSLTVQTQGAQIDAAKKAYIANFVKAETAASQVAQNSRSGNPSAVTNMFNVANGNNSGNVCNSGLMKPIAAAGLTGIVANIQCKTPDNQLDQKGASELAKLLTKAGLTNVQDAAVTSTQIENLAQVLLQERREALAEMMAADSNGQLTVDQALRQVSIRNAKDALKYLSENCVKFQPRAAALISSFR